MLRTEYILILALLSLIISSSSVVAQTSKADELIKQLSSKDTNEVAIAIIELGEMQYIPAIPFIAEHLHQMYFDPEKDGFLNFSEQYEEFFPALFVLKKFSIQHSPLVLEAVTAAIMKKERSRRFLINASMLIRGITLEAEYKAYVSERHMLESSTIATERLKAFIKIYMRW